jgi:hypothetical protein
MQIVLFLSSHTRTHARARALRHARTLCTQSTLESCLPCHFEADRLGWFNGLPHTCQPFQTAAKTGARIMSLVMSQNIVQI